MLLARGSCKKLRVEPEVVFFTNVTSNSLINAIVLGIHECGSLGIQYMFPTQLWSLSSMSSSDMKFHKLVDMRERNVCARA